MANKSKATPIILGLLTCIGVVSTGILAHKAGRESLKKEKTFTDETTTEEKVKELAPIYAPVIFTGVATFACILGTTKLSFKSQASLAGAYSLLRETYQDYAKEVINRFGKDTHEDILRTISVEKPNDNRVITPTCFGTIDNCFDQIHEEELLCYDYLSKRYYNSTISRILEAESAVNRNMILGAFVEVNDYYNFLGITPDPKQELTGWCVNDEFYYLDFEHTLGTTDDGLEYIIISPVFMPMPFDYDEEWPVEYCDKIGWS